MADHELYIDSVTHDYAGKPVLNGVYLTCKPGEIIGLLGRNGSGKTTLLKIIFGALKAKHKYQRVNGEVSMAAYKDQQVAYLPQGRLIPDITVKKAVRLFENSYTEALCEVALIAGNYNRKMSELSGGNRRLVECLLILYSKAEYILLDEPFSQISPLLIQEIKTHINRLRGAKGFIISDHYHQHIRDISSRIILLHNGSNYQVNSAEDLVLHGYLPPPRP